MSVFVLLLHSCWLEGTLMLVYINLHGENLEQIICYNENYYFIFQRNVL